MNAELYRKMYAIVCGAVDQAIDLLSSEKTLQAKALLE